MKYLIQHKKEFAITVAAFIMAVFNLIRAIRSKEITQELIVAVLVTGTTVLAWYYNMPTSEENDYHTDVMRLEKEKEELPDGYFEDEEEDEEGVGLAEDEEATEEIDDGPNDGGEADE